MYIYNKHVIHTEVLASNNFSGAIVPLGYANPPTQHLIEIIKGQCFVILKLTWCKPIIYSQFFDNVLS